MYPDRYLSSGRPCFSVATGRSFRCASPSAEVSGHTPDRVHRPTTFVPQLASEGAGCPADHVQGTSHAGW
jgi:hypothetical protein